MLTITVSPAGRGKFTAHLREGRQLCQRTFAPFLAAARQLLADGRDPDTKIIMRHAGSDIICLTSTIGVAAKLSVKEDRGRLQFVPWEPFPRRVKATASEKAERVPEVAPDAEESLYDATRRKAA
jgi:hypothetical protein